MIILSYIVNSRPALNTQDYIFKKNNKRGGYCISDNGQCSIHRGCLNDHLFLGLFFILIYMHLCISVCVYICVRVHVHSDMCRYPVEARREYWIHCSCRYSQLWATFVSSGNWTLIRCNSVRALNYWTIALVSWLTIPQYVCVLTVTHRTPAAELSFAWTWLPQSCDHGSRWTN